MNMNPARCGLIPASKSEPDTCRKFFSGASESKKMAIDWIKMRVDLQSHPKVVRILSAIRPHDVLNKTDKFRVIGGLHAVWSVFDAHCEDGVLNGYTPETLDHVIGWDGFSSALIGVGWLIENTGFSLAMPEFLEHNGQSAKRRAEDQKRKRDSRNSTEPVRKLSANDADKKQTREEKSINTPIPPKGAESVKVSEKQKTPAITLMTWLEAIKASAEKPIPENDPVFAYAEQVGIPPDYLRLCWREFRDRYSQPGAKRYRDWRGVFRKAVRGNWFKLWWVDAAGAYALTTVGKQAEMAAKQ